MDLAESRREIVRPVEPSLESLRGRDEAAFEALVRAHRGRLYRIVFRVLGSHADADEALQETFVRAWRALPRFRGEASVGTWLVRIAMNVARTARVRRPDHDALEDAGPLHAAGRSGLEHVEGGREADAVRRAVATLPPRQRETVWLKVFDDRTYREVAEIMGLSEGAVKAHFHQAVSNLRKRMAGNPETEGAT